MYNTYCIWCGLALNVHTLILDIFVVYGECVNLTIVSAWHLFIWIRVRVLLCRLHYVVSSDKCT